MLESAISSPMNHHYYAQETDLVRLAAVLNARLIRNHPFGSSNKRTALLSTNLFLLLNGKVHQQIAAELKDSLVLERAHSLIAEGKTDESELAEIYRSA